MGDIIDWKERKLAHKAERHAGVVVKNLVSLLNGCSAPTEYRGTTEMIVVAIGKVFRSFALRVPTNASSGARLRLRRCTLGIGARRGVVRLDQVGGFGDKNDETAFGSVAP